MGTIYKHKDGYLMFKSDNGVRYELLEGKTMGGDQVYRSDIVFVMLDYYDFLPIVDELVGYFFGATELERMTADAIDFLEVTVNRWETSHSELIDEIKKGETA